MHITRRHFAFLLPGAAIAASSTRPERARFRLVYGGNGHSTRNEVFDTPEEAYRRAFRLFADTYSIPHGLAIQHGLRMYGEVSYDGFWAHLTKVHDGSRT